MSGRALIDVLSPLPGLAITWVDTAEQRFPLDTPPQVNRLWGSDLARIAIHAPKEAAHLIVTYSHEIDFALCHTLLTHGFETCGLIGSETKKVRFAKTVDPPGASCDADRPDRLPHW